MEATDVTRDQAQKIYEQADKNLKVAILMQLLQIDKQEAQKRLQLTNGHVGQAIITEVQL